MKKALVAICFALASTVAIAGGTEYVMRVDGLACPYCAYGVEKKLNQIEGVEDIHVDLNRGLVTVKVADGVSLTESRMKRLFHEAGFTYRSMTERPYEY